MANCTSFRRATHSLKINFKQVLLFHNNEIIQLPLFLYLVSKLNQNLLAVNSYKIKTTSV